jgi:hypothetical protein
LEPPECDGFWKDETCDFWKEDACDVAGLWKPPPPWW